MDLKQDIGIIALLENARRSCGIAQEVLGIQITFEPWITALLIAQEVRKLFYISTKLKSLIKYRKNTAFFVLNYKYCTSGEELTILSH